MMSSKFIRIMATAVIAIISGATLSAQTPQRASADTSSFRKWIDNMVTSEMDEYIANMPNIEVGKGISFSPKDKSFKTTIRFRMQNMAEMTFGDRMKTTEIDGQVKRLRLRFDGYIFSPKLIYSIQLGFTGSDAKPTANGKSNIILDAIAYYKPSSSWNFGFGQAKIKLNRSKITSSGALQFCDRSIVNSEFSADRDFGFFGEYHYGSIDNFALSSFAALTTGEGRNWGATSSNGLAYSGRVEVFPMGRFHAKGEYIEGDTYFEETPKLMFGVSYSFNHKAQMARGFTGSLLTDGETRNFHSYCADLSFKYRGFAVNADYMGRHVKYPVLDSGIAIFNGSGINVQASYIFDRKWELAFRNSSMLPTSETQSYCGYKLWNQSTLGLTRYIIGHSLKLQLDLSYNNFSKPVSNGYDRLAIRFQLELGL